jgi:cytochrome oxidase assembly protein ShyY1
MQDRTMAQLITGKPVLMTGYIRFPVAAGVLTPNVEHDKRMWFGRDHLVIVQALGWEEVAPFYIDLETPVPANGIPKPGPLQVHLPNELQLSWIASTHRLARAAVDRGSSPWLSGNGVRISEAVVEGRSRQ